MAANEETVSIDTVKKTLWDSLEALGENISGETLTALLEIIEGGSGGGSDLPDVTAADNGKLLGVNNGEWDKVDAPSGTLFVPFTITKDPETDDLICSTTADFADAAAAVVAQTPVYVEANFLGATVLYLKLANKVPTTGTPSIISFSSVADFAGSEEAPQPALIAIVWADGGARDIKIIPLAVAE